MAAGAGAAGACELAHARGDALRAKAKAAAARPAVRRVRAPAPDAETAEYVEISDTELWQTDIKLILTAVEEAVSELGLDDAPGEPEVSRIEDLDEWIKWVLTKLGYDDLVAVIKTKGLAGRIGNKKAKVIQILKHILFYIE
jgi:hypothetical protein